MTSSNHSLNSRRRSQGNGTSHRHRHTDPVPSTEPIHQDSYTLNDHGYFQGNGSGSGSGGRVPETPLAGGSMDLHVRVGNAEQFWQGGCRAGGLR
jgi:hypothetical protein